MLSRMLSRKPPWRCGVAGAELAFQLLDAGIGALERLVLHQRGLHQRIDGVGRLAQPVADRALGLRIALGILQRGEAVEQLGDELAFSGVMAVSSQDTTRQLM